MLVISKKVLKNAIFIGVAVYILIVGGYILLKNILEISLVTGALNQGVGVNKGNFVLVALYISFMNSFLEEVFFRGFGFLYLKKFTSKGFALIFSSLSFALYHVEMMIVCFTIGIFFSGILALL